MASAWPVLKPPGAAGQEACGLNFEILLVLDCVQSGRMATLGKLFTPPQPTYMEREDAEL